MSVDLEALRQYPRCSEAFKAAEEIERQREALRQCEMYRDRAMRERDAAKLGPDRQMLRAEVDRLRAALERITLHELRAGPQWLLISELRNIAREALVSVEEK